MSIRIQMTLLDRLMKPGMVGAARRFADVAGVKPASLQETISRWRRRRAIPKPETKAKLAKVAAKAEEWLQCQRELREAHLARCQRLRKALWQVVHSGCSMKAPGIVTMQDVADVTGLQRQTLINFRTNERPMSPTNVAKVERALRKLGLRMPEKSDERRAGVPASLQGAR